MAYKHEFKRTWDVLKEALGTKHISQACSPISITIGDEIVENKNRIAELFNSHFTNISSEIHMRLPSTSDEIYTSKQHICNIFLDPIEYIDVIEAISKLKPKHSTSYDDILTKLLKEAIYISSHPLSHISNVSLSIRVFPSDTKKTKVIPIYERSDP